VLAVRDGLANEVPVMILYSAIIRMEHPKTVVMSGALNSSLRGRVVAAGIDADLPGVQVTTARCVIRHAVRVKLVRREARRVRNMSVARVSMNFPLCVLT
jgi:hypothetical protein